MLTNTPPDKKNFTLLRLLTVIAIVATLSAFAPWQAAPATPPMPPEAFLPPPSPQRQSQQPRHHFVPPLGVKP